MKRFLSVNNMTLKRYLGVDLLVALFVILPGKPPYNKIEIVLYFPRFADDLFFSIFANNNVRVNELAKLLFANLNKFPCIV